ncbi:MAG: tRNA 2-thiocytidine(32) synthetase TtcA [Deltaproteobacteria bacterium]|nr:tRNA 2-thiocytidine(32) synthetase TtcA [Deltaproteobacteria bacterium]
MSRNITTADKKIQGLLGKAIRDYDMIADGDHLAVAVSGGKDSMALLFMLKERLKWVPIRYDLLAIHLDMGFEGTQPQRIEAACREMGVPFYFEKTDYGILAHGPENKENPCFLCSWLRRKHLFQLSKVLNFTKIALGHNKDDIIETLFLNMFFSGELSTMLPRQSLFEGRLTIIRPLALLEESKIKGFARRMNLFEIPNPCPSAQNSSRKEIKEFLSVFYARNKKIRGNIFHALSHCRPEYLLPLISKRTPQNQGKTKIK